MEIKQKVHLIQSSIVNVYLIIQDDNSITLIDTGLPRSEKIIFDYITSLGKDIDLLKQIIITHADLDHYGCLAALKAKTGAIVLSSQVEAEAIEKGGESRPLKVNKIIKFMLRLSRLYYRVQPIKVDQFLKEGDQIPILGGLRIIETPGHTPGHISLWSPREGILFTGDSIRTSQTSLIPSHGMNTWDEQLALASYRKQAGFNPQLICPGHGPVVTNPDFRLSTGRF